jgi:TIR domain
MPGKVFLSYTRSDLETARRLERALVAAGVEVWRDQEGLYGGAQWPKAIGEAIASSAMLVLVWSARAARSHFVELEWTIALALKKSIVPCMLDNTHLPPSLSAINWVSCEDLQTALPAIIRAVHMPKSQADPVRQSEVIDKLQGVDTTEPEEALRKAKVVFSQEDWGVSGSAYAAGDNIINHKSWPNVIVVLSAIAAVILVIILTLTFRNDGRNKENPGAGGTANRVENQNLGNMSDFKGYVEDEDGNLIDGARLEIKELPGQTSPIIGLTTSDGDFYIANIPAAIGTRCVVVVTAPGFPQHSESIVVLPGPKMITLKRAR